MVKQSPYVLPGGVQGEAWSLNIYREGVGGSWALNLEDRDVQRRVGCCKLQRDRAPKGREVVPDCSHLARAPGGPVASVPTAALVSQGSPSTPPTLVSPSYHVQATPAHPQRESGGIRLHVGLKRDVRLPGGVPALPARGAHLRGKWVLDRRAASVFP